MVGVSATGYYCLMEGRMKRTLASWILLAAATGMAATPELFTLTVQDAPVENGKVLTATFREIERKPDASIVEIQWKSGGSVSSSMFVMRGMCGVARARGEQFFTSRPVPESPGRMEVTFPRTGPAPDRFGPLMPGEATVFSMAQCDLLKF